MKSSCIHAIMNLSLFFKDWLIPDPDPNSGRAYCRLCNHSLRAHKSDLNTHKTSVKHLERENEIGPASKQQKLCTFGNQFTFSFYHCILTN